MQWNIKEIRKERRISLTNQWEVQGQLLFFRQWSSTDWSSIFFFATASKPVHRQLGETSENKWLKLLLRIYSCKCVVFLQIIILIIILFHWSIIIPMHLQGNNMYQKWKIKCNNKVIKYWLHAYCIFYFFNCNEWWTDNYGI